MTLLEQARIIDNNRRYQIPIEFLRKVVLHTTRRNGENFFLHEMAIDSLKSPDELEDWFDAVYTDETGGPLHRLTRRMVICRVELLLELFSEYIDDIK